MTRAQRNNRATIVWYRNDLRVHDHAPLLYAAERGVVVPVFVWDELAEAPWQLGSASRWWLRESVIALDQSLRRLGSRLLVRRGPSAAVLRELASETGATQLVFERWLWPQGRHVEDQLRTVLAAQGCEAVPFPANLLWQPEQVQSDAGSPYRVFTAFYRKVLTLPVAGARHTPATLHAPAVWPAGETVDSLPKSKGGWEAYWRPGEPSARRRFAAFLGDRLAAYGLQRDSLEPPGTSLLSAHLRFGELSVRELWARVSDWARVQPPSAQAGAQAFLRQLVWRDFAYHSLFHSPALSERPLDRRFEQFEWEDNPEALAAWKDGRTGYPLVDAGMRQLRETGFLPNRVRMVVGSFLGKHLLVPWQEGARWFWDTLLDADLANNSLNWQWVAGCGVDPMPFTRIFDPVRQGLRFDASAAYVKQWVPELSGLPATWVHRPWQAPAEILKAAGIHLGKSYPAPIVDHAAARRRALLRYETTRNTRGRG